VHRAQAAASSPAPGARRFPGPHFDAAHTRHALTASSHSDINCLGDLHGCWEYHRLVDEPIRFRSVAGDAVVSNIRNVVFLARRASRASIAFAFLDAQGGCKARNHTHRRKGREYDELHTRAHPCFCGHNACILRSACRRRSDNRVVGHRAHDELGHSLQLCAMLMNALQYQAAIMKCGNLKQS
jgi:hypothetical protein